MAGCFLPFGAGVKVGLVAVLDAGPGLFAGLEDADVDGEVDVAADGIEAGV